jgi:putative protein-disulfide isomerase
MEQREGRRAPQNKRLKPDRTDGIEITFYTDPLCCWSWGLQPQWRRLQEEAAGSMTVTYKMAGLLPSWNHFHDAVNSIQKPIQMGPEWMHAKALSGVPINDRIWITDPPASSYPACIAVKCAGLQSPELVAPYLHLLQEAVMVKSLNIAKAPVLVEIARQLAGDDASFHLEQFREDLVGQAGIDAFRKDLQESKYLNITRLPTLVFRSAGGPAVLLSGYQSYESLKEAWLKTATKL